MTPPPIRLTPAPIRPPTPGILEAKEPIPWSAFPTPVVLPPAKAPPIAVAAVLAIPPDIPPKVLPKTPPILLPKVLIVDFNPPVNLGASNFKLEKSGISTFNPPS